MDVVIQNPFQVLNGGKFYNDAHSTVHDELKDNLRAEFSNFILQEGYSCVGAQAAVHGGTFAIGDFGSMDADDTPRKLAYGLMEYILAMSDNPSDFLTYIAIFPESIFTDEIGFEKMLWKLLNGVHQENSQHFGWNPEYSDDPADSNFSFSFGEHGFFLVGLHPKSSRKARRFKYPAIAFNFQHQFDALREKGRFEIMRSAIRDREINFQGSINPMLADYGEGQQAPQYSGRKTEKDWKCPFNNSK